MNLSISQSRVKLFLVFIAAAIGIGSIISTNKLVQRLAIEERKKVGLWAEGTKQLSMLNNEDNQEISLILLKVVQNNETVPVILTDEQGNIIASRNIDPGKNNELLQKKLLLMKQDPIEISLPDGSKNYVYYEESILQQKLYYYPFVQLGIIALFVFIAYLAFNSSWKAEQNLLWVGMSKETAHQLGTPVSSLLAWMELLKEKFSEKSMFFELERDINRLKKITERFSKIGSEPLLKKENINSIVFNTLAYLKTRVSKKIVFNTNIEPSDIIEIPLNAPLFEWVIENVSKNSIDAMEGEGTISISILNQSKLLIIDISDTGSGIPKAKFKSIFSPGYSTKKKGWGLGLSLSKRIIESYHNGKIFVKHSEIGKGSTFRIILKK